MGDIVSANNDSKDQIVKVLAEAFDSDPVFNYICSNQDFPRLLFECVAPLFLAHHHAFITKCESGALLCLPPGIKVPVHLAFYLLRNVYRRFGFGALVRALRVYRHFDKNHYIYPHFYVFAVGVLKKNQGKGMGSQLLKGITRRCDRLNVPAYLENTNEKNLPLYLRFEFQILKKIKFDEQTTVWFMLREPFNEKRHQ